MLKRCQNIPDTMSFPQGINHLPGKKGMFTPSCKDQQDEPPAWPWFSEANLTSVTVYHDVSKPFFECLSFSSKTVTPTAGRVYALLIFSPSVPALAYHRNTIRMWLSNDLNANFLKVWGSDNFCNSIVWVLKLKSVSSWFNSIPLLPLKVQFQSE